ncbi:Dihydroorotase [Roseomonas mucosa]|uniref:Dihydroorotase n=1 Tax=Roseomonas mucosa TaxID=207340 RepID=A0A379N4L9_9PROT|nr:MULTISPECIES: dihydroorotase [Roseomonas]MBS5901463.1 dihydroorotase [Acetobacteraceae bacterium]AWV23750.1 Dihydroorotase [Roseomonas mucosa]MCG7353350.1 dihydroorotase [Roseomonas mucosa]MCG7357774.1 dihydroorotase [Roseomonas mucosa]MDT8288943.1 dihydroorotase [Roseomonas mucosa]
MAAYDLILRGGTCVLPWGEEKADVGVRDGRIAALGDLRTDTAEEVVDCAGLHVLPGLIDPHVHLRDPGQGAGPDMTVESIETGTRAAILGGITALFDMPNTNPAITTREALDNKRAYLAGRAWCDMGLYVGATRTNIAGLAELELQPNVCGIKVFAGSSTGDLMVEDDASLEAVMRSGRRRIAYHSEDEYRLQARKPLYAAGGPHALHAEWRDVECAFLGTRRLMALAHKTRRPAHILHVSTAEELDYLKDYRDVATAEVLVNHLTQVAPEAYERLGAYAVMNPPIRDARHMEAAWAAVRDGTVDCIGSDHAPHSRAAKERPWPATAAGLTGVQTLVPVMLNHVAEGRLSLARLVDLMSAGPARVYGVTAKGRLAAGYDADFTIVDLKRRRSIEESWIASPCGWTPFAGMECTGWPVMTVIRGAPVMREDEVIGAPRGEPVRFAEARGG